MNYLIYLKKWKGHMGLKYDDSEESLEAKLAQ
jgi:hypothetical protein